MVRTLFADECLIVSTWKRRKLLHVDRISRLDEHVCPRILITDMVDRKRSIERLFRAIRDAMVESTRGLTTNGERMKMEIAG